MNTRSRHTPLAAALLGLVAATAALQPAVAEEVKKPQHTLVDTRTTGSIPAGASACDPNAPNAGIVCRVTEGEKAPRYPAAPVNPAFGF
ncbi:hypothetical protein [Oricola sp.]|uniref:hypothetical protein n=1 Tax=Oricola sp. TaxID=1979950 RepID=UPI0025EDCE1E|nr:hypothetical protein [Oricola sp.]MCI5076237.1 hypothetical protein [Oricola sp.]